ncbi:predicted protein [Naegleria gruberi]|uniref:Predicted protein n=1 Tax=Naegleria gruberi TaxID=5762 RepID=D2V0S3_NAEGR|nr:uncharacterized protein NAEGRDRAFT_62396 [Naegleria gruberi]EFC49564.1 predicted protein [Naegleria gruberi]|eukprot:XP_002682308.1 predicted protein [Naegleria gruberi strain NEG-M]
MSKLTSLSNDSLMDILLFCKNDLKTVMSLALTCSDCYRTVTESFDRFWIVILNEMAERNPTGFKSKTLSIVNHPLISKRSIKLLTIVKSQIRFERKRKILKDYNGLEMLAKYRYFENLQIHDPYVNKLISKERKESLRYSAENILREVFEDSHIALIDCWLTKVHSFEVKDLIDALFRKSGAHLELNVKNRTQSSSIYDFWKTQDPSYQDNLFHWYKVASLSTVDSTLLFLKFFFLELPNNLVYGQRVSETGYEQEKRNTGAFKKQLDNLTVYAHRVLMEAIQIFKKELYDE